MKSKNLSEKILKSVKSRDFRYIQLESLVETNQILNRSGENFRKFIFSFEDQKPVLVCVMDQKYLKNYYELVDLLRDNNINAEIFLDSKKNLGKQLTFANKRELPVAIICGENEFNNNTITIKNLKGVKGENNQTIPKAELINEIKKLI